MISSTGTVFCTTTTSSYDFTNITKPNSQTENFLEDFQLTDKPSSAINDYNSPWTNDSTGFEHSDIENNPNTRPNPFNNPFFEDEDEIIAFGSLSDEYLFSGFNPEALVKKISGNKIEFIIALQQDTDPSILYEYLSSFNIDISEYLPGINVLLANVPVNLAFNPTSNLINDITNKPFVKYVEPNYYCTSAYIPNDPSWDLQWGSQLIGMESAWDFQLGSTDVKVAIIDSGIDYTHPDLVANYLPIGYDWINDDSDPMDDHGHGTHCAGVVAASIGNALGIAGIANVSFFAEKFLGSDNYGSYVDAANAIIHATDMGADILSNSWGGYGYSDVLADAVEYALSNDVIFTAAAMNDATSIAPYPASLPGVIAVSATNPSDTLASFSNYGDWIDIAAPGVGIYSTYPGNSYVSWDGTSMATPHVSGLAALLLSQYPSYTSDQIEQLIMNTAVDLGDPGFDISFGWGRIDASTAIFGFQDHDLRAILHASSIVPVDLPTLIIGQCQNLGLETEYDVPINLFLDGILVNSTIIPVINSREIFEITHEFYPSEEKVYSASIEIDVVPGEINIANNIMEKGINAVHKQITPEIGDKMGYNGFGYEYSDISPFYLNFEIVGILSDTEYEILMTYFDYESKSEYSDYYILNPYTREFVGNWDAFPYWINATKLSIGSYVDIFTYGGQEGQVIDETIVDYYGTPINAWVVQWIYDDFYDTLIYSKGDGILLDVTIPDYGSYFNIVYTNIEFATWNVHNLKGVIAPVTAILNTPTTVEVLLHNTGNFDEYLNATLNINGLTYEVENYYLIPDGYVYLYFDWTPMVEGDYTITLEVDPTYDEYYLDDNFDEMIVEIVDISDLGFISVYVYDDNTMLPLDSAEVYVFDSDWEMVDYGFTDIDGFYNVTGLYVDEYYIEIYREGYSYAAQYVQIDYIGEGEYVYFYLIGYSVGYSYIEVYVYNSLTYEPMVDVYLDLYEFGDWRDYGNTDINGFYNFTYLGVSSYDIYAWYPGFFDQMESVTINWDGEGVVVNFFLEPVTYGDSFIEVYVYDSITFDPIPDAYVYTYDEYWNYIGWGYTDFDGFYNITNLGVGGYYVEVYAYDYYWQTQYAVIDFDGEAEYLYFYLDPESAPGEGFIEVYVYDDITYDPIEYAFVDVYDDYWNYIDSGMTDFNGFYNVTGLGVNGYHVEVYAEGYDWQSQYTTIDYDGEAEYMYFYLYQESVYHEIFLYNPDEGETIEGGSVEVYYYSEDIYELYVLEIYVNGEFISYIYNDPYIPLLIVPIFQEGVNTIELVGYFYDGGIASVSVSINSINVVPIINVDVGDYLFMQVDQFNAPKYHYFFFTFDEWVSTYEINASVIVERYENDVLYEYSEFWLVINILNGYIPEANMWWLNQKFIFFTAIDSPSNTGEYADYGDWFSFWYWNDLFIIHETTYWGDNEVWMANNTYGDFAYIDKNSALLLYYESPDYYSMYILDTNILQPPDTEPPIVVDTPDLFMEYGSVDNYIEWVATDALPDYYIIVKDGEFIDEGTWLSNVQVIICIDGLEIGTYEYIIIFVDLAGNYAWDTVMVTVVDSTAPEILGPYDITYEGGTTGHQLVWMASDFHPYGFTIFLDGVELINGSWINDFPIFLNIDELDPGVYEYSISFVDLYGNEMTDSVIVTVVDTIAPIIPYPPEDIILKPGKGDAKDGFEITWIALDSFASHYELYLNNELISTGGWQSGIPIYIYMVIFIPGEYEFVLNLYDYSGNMIADSVLVTISRVGRVDGFASYLSFFSLIGLAVIFNLVKKRRKKITK
ncbi:MAG: S8 family serine peptidase [Asgard group archaeon]|nr:S8 family serine peptidase [Asgard group archaeon]